MDATQQKLKALDAFKDWSNYLLVTTVAALGWTAEKNIGDFVPCMKAAAIVAFAMSIVFAILTLALVPHVAEDITEIGGTVPSIYRVYWKGWCVDVRLTRFCLPQHVFFLLGIFLFAAGTAFSRHYVLWLMVMLVGTLCLLLVLGRLPRE